MNCIIKSVQKCVYLVGNYGKGAVGFEWLRLE